jgi:hypothetical protein
MKLNYKIYDAPISISAHALQIDFDGLYKLLIEKMDEYNPEKTTNIITT